jgi:phosphate transport system substrate-binding protein
MNGKIHPGTPQPSAALMRHARVFGLIVGVFLIAGPISVAVHAASDAPAVSGAGATFPYPIYAKWANRYNQITGLKLNYQAVGSGAGLAQIKAKTVDFGASDEPLESDSLAKEGLVQFPMVMGGVVPVVNLKDVRKGQLRLTGDLLADIFLGKIKMWNDRRILAVNQDVHLPEQAITVVHRADGSGTTWIFTNYLSKVSPEWKESVKSGKSVSWPTGIGGKGNDGVAALVKKTEGAIGYVEFAYAIKERLKFVQIQNAAGRYVSPTIQTFQAAAANADWKNAQGFYISLIDQPGDRSWPIIGATYILVHKDQTDPAKAKALLKFFDWCFKNGSDMAVSLHYVPIPGEVSGLVKAAWKNGITAGGQSVWE